MSDDKNLTEVQETLSRLQIGCSVPCNLSTGIHFNGLEGTQTWYIYRVSASKI